MKTSTCLVLCVAMTFLPVAFAANKEKGAAIAMRKLQASLNEVTAERDALTAEKAKLGQELDQAKNDLTQEKKKAESQVQQHAKEVSAQAKVSDDLRTRLENTTAKLREVIDKYNELNAANKHLTQDHTELTGQHQGTVTQLKICSGKNRKMSEVAREVILNYQKCLDRNAIDELVDSEPIFQMNTVKFETLLQDVEDKIKREHYEEDKAKSGATGLSAH